MDWRRRSAPETKPLQQVSSQGLYSHEARDAHSLALMPEQQRGVCGSPGPQEDVVIHTKIHVVWFKYVQIPDEQVPGTEFAFRAHAGPSEKVLILAEGVSVAMRRCTSSAL